MTVGSLNYGGVRVAHDGACSIGWRKGEMRRGEKEKDQNTPRGRDSDSDIIGVNRLLWHHWWWSNSRTNTQGEIERDGERDPRDWGNWEGIGRGEKGVRAERWIGSQERERDEREEGNRGENRGEITASGKKWEGFFKPLGLNDAS